MSFLPDEGLEEGADYVVRGEGEQTFVELIKCTFHREGELSAIDGLSYVEDGEHRHNPDRERITDLSSLPWPDLTLIEGFEKLRVIPVMTSRGCPYDCKFCSVTSMFGHRYRFRERR